MVDVKKLITGFLILATISASLIFVFGGIFNSSAPPQQDLTAETPPAAPQNTASSVPANAFKEALPNDSQDATAIVANQISDDDLPPVTETANLTQLFAQQYTRQALKMNPAGPAATDDQGKPILASPDAATMYSNIAQSDLVKNLQIPDWQAEVDAIPVHATGPGNVKAFSDYNVAFNDILDKYFVQPQATTLVNAKSLTADTDALKAQQLISQAKQKLEELPVPDQLLGLHKSFLKLLTYEEKSLALIPDAQTDPLKASLILRAKDVGYHAAIDDFKNELSKVRLLQTSDKGTKDALTAIVTAILGIQTANAQWIVFDPTIFAEMIWEFLQDFLLQLLKNLLINTIQNGILGWIQGGGRPKFWQNFRQSFYNAWNTAASQAISNIAPGLCSNFRPQLQVQLNSGINMNPLGNQKTTCTLNQIVGNLKNFYGDMRNGGWYNYSVNTRPENDAFMALYLAQMTTDQRAQNQKNSQQHKSVASQGFISVAQCADQSTPDGEGFCADGSEADITAPGKAISDILSTGNASNMHLIVNANSIAGIAATVLISLLSGLIGAGNGGLLGTNPAPPPPPPPPPPPVSCNPASQTVNAGSPASVGATAGTSPYTWSAPGGVPPTGSGALFTTTFSTPGTYSATVTDSKGGNAKCTIIAQ